ncbi:CST complex subunit CTC1, partial [Menidia menidia]
DPGDPVVHQALSVGALLGSLESGCWSSLSLAGLLPPDGSSLTRTQLNAALSWSCRALTSDPRAGDGLRPRPLLLVGVLQLSSGPSGSALELRDATGGVPCVVTDSEEGRGQTAASNTAWIGTPRGQGPRPLLLVGVLQLSSGPSGSAPCSPAVVSPLAPPPAFSLRPRPLLLVGVLQLSSGPSGSALELRDATGGVPCVVTDSEEGRGQTAASNTAWIGCLVCVLHFTMVTERFLQSDFPSYQHLEEEGFITERRSRVYLQFSLDQVRILSPSVAMAMQLKGEEQHDVTARKRRKEEGSSSVTMTTTAVGRPCVSMVIQMEEKEGLSRRGAGPEGGEAGPQLGFSARAALIGPVCTWGRDPKNGPMAEREADGATNQKVVLVFSAASSRWFSVLHPGSFYRIVAANTQDPSVLIGRGVSGRIRVQLHSDSRIQVRPDWRFHTLTRVQRPPTCTQAPPPVLSVSQVLDCRSDVVCFQGLVTERISVGGGEHTGVRLTLCDQSGRSIRVYLNLSHAPYPPGLLPGNTLLLSAFQRKLSRAGGVYCCLLPVSCVTVMSLPVSSCAPPSAPMMHLGPWALSSDPGRLLGKVRGHVVRLLSLQLQWTCSLCGSVYTQFLQSCSSACGSSSSVFQSRAKLVIDDGTGEAHVWVSGPLVRSLLGLADPQWEGLQRAVRVKGHIRVSPGGRSQGSADPLHLFLEFVCSSEFVSRPIVLTCRKHTTQSPEELRSFIRADRTFLTRLGRPLQLSGLQLDQNQNH